MRTTSIVILSLALVSLVISAPVHGAVKVDLIYEFDGNSLGTTSFGTIDLGNNASGGVDVTITADTASLLGGDIHEWYFNLPDKFSGMSAGDFVLSGFGGVSNKDIGSFSLFGPDPSIAGGAGASFEWAVNFGNGKNGNGALTTATFNINNTAIGLQVQDFIDAELSYPNNTPAVAQAVHFQSTGVFGADSETVGGNVHANPEPSSVVIWLALGGICAGVARHRSRKQRRLP